MDQHTCLWRECLVNRSKAWERHPSLWIDFHNSYWQSLQEVQRTGRRQSSRFLPYSGTTPLFLLNPPPFFQHGVKDQPYCKNNTVSMQSQQVCPLLHSSCMDAWNCLFTIGESEWFKYLAWIKEIRNIFMEFLKYLYRWRFIELDFKIHCSSGFQSIYWEWEI